MTGRNFNTPESNEPLEDDDFLWLTERDEDAAADKADDEYSEREPKEDNE